MCLFYVVMEVYIRLGMISLLLCKRALNTPVSKGYARTWGALALVAAIILVFPFGYDSGAWHPDARASGFPVFCGRETFPNRITCSTADNHTVPCRLPWPFIPVCTQ